VFRLLSNIVIGRKGVFGVSVRRASSGLRAGRQSSMNVGAGSDIGMTIISLKALAKNRRSGKGWIFLASAGARLASDASASRRRQTTEKRQERAVVLIKATGVSVELKRTPAIPAAFLYKSLFRGRRVKAGWR